MGANICKSCENFSKAEESNISENLNKNIIVSDLPAISGSMVSSLKKGSVPTLNNDFMKTTIMKTSPKNEEYPSTPKMQVDENEINKIVLKYKINLIISAFRKLKEMKEEAHKIITIRKDLKEKMELMMVEGNEYLDVDLFPEENYNFLGNIFNNKEDGFGIQYFPESSAKYVGNFLNGRRIDYCIFEDKSKFYIYKGQTRRNFTGMYGIYYNYAKEITYEGDWINNSKDGIGIETYKDGSK